MEEEEDDTVNAGDSADGDDILGSVDNSVLGGDVLESSTEDTALEQETGMDTGSADGQNEDSSDTEDMDNGDWDGSEDTDGSLDGSETADTADELDTSSLTEDQDVYKRQTSASSAASVPSSFSTAASSLVCTCLLYTSILVPLH